MIRSSKEKMTDWTGGATEMRPKRRRRTEGADSSCGDGRGGGRRGEQNNLD
jgi:hypothetical protein